MIHWKWGHRARRGCGGWSAADLEMRLGLHLKEDLCDPLEMGWERGSCSRSSAVEIRMRLEGGIWRNRGKDEDLQSGHPLPWWELDSISCFWTLFFLVYAFSHQPVIVVVKCH